MRKMVEHQRTHWVGCGWEGGPAHYECLRGEFTILRARIAELERDRERLGWLSRQPVDFGDSDTGPVYSTHCAEPDCTHLHEPNLRAAIDAAMLHALMAPSDGEPK